MGDDEEEIVAFQRKQEEEDENASREGVSDDEDEEEDELMDLEKVRMREGLSDRQKQLITKVEGIRRQLKKLIDKHAQLKSEEELEFDDAKIKAAIKGVEKR